MGEISSPICRNTACLRPPKFGAQRTITCASWDSGQASSSIGGHVDLSRTGDFSRSRITAEVAFVAHLERRSQVRPAAPMSWIEDPRRRWPISSKRGFHQAHFPLNGSPTCTVGPFSSMVFVEFGGGHVARPRRHGACFCAQIDHRPSRQPEARVEKSCAASARPARRHDQTVAVVGFVASATSRRHGRHGRKHLP